MNALVKIQNKYMPCTAKEKRTRDSNLTTVGRLSVNSNTWIYEKISVCNGVSTLDHVQFLGSRSETVVVRRPAGSPVEVVEAREAGLLLPKRDKSFMDEKS